VNLNSPAGISVHAPTNEVFVADGYGNRRIIVFDADTGAYKRHWGAYGKRPDDAASRERTYKGPPPEQFNLLHGLRISNDGLVYVADRYNSRIQVFRLDGTFVKEAFIARETLDSRGTASDISFSADPAQRYLYVVDAANYKVRILDRQTLEILSSFGRLGYYAGQWKWVHGIATDSKGNIYTSESQGNRVQKFTLKSAPATR
jgi:DNA-binding beta-propeller fold protein YncE